MNYTENPTVTVNNETTTKITVLRRLFTGNENHHISLDDASRLTKRFRDSVPAHAIKGGYFGRVIFEKILEQDGCVGIRFYLATLESGNPTVVLSGVTKDGNDLWKGLLAEDALPCPPICGEFNVLNSSEHERIVERKRKVQILTGHENHFVTLAQASEWTRNFRTDRDRNAVKGLYFGRRILEMILAQERCVGLRFYFALNTDQSPTLVLVGIQPNGNDLVNGILGEDALPCPPICGELNPLNA